MISKLANFKVHYNNILQLIYINFRIKIMFFDTQYTLYKEDFKEIVISEYEDEGKLSLSYNFKQEKSNFCNGGNFVKMSM